MTQSVTSREAGLSLLSPNYDAVLCDIWGVVHNGVRAHPQAVDALCRFRQNGGTAILVSNAPVPHTAVIDMLDRLGVTKDAYDRVITSGDMARDLMNRYRGQTIYHIGPDQDEPLFEGAEITRGALDDASAIVLSDLPEDGNKPEDFVDDLKDWLARDLPVICANPDKVVEVGDQLIYCAGSVADLFEQMGGTVLQAGKPHSPIYSGAKAMIDTIRGADIPPHKMLAIGDSVRTDATGAAGFGADFMFITGSIHAEELDAFGLSPETQILELVAPSGAKLVGYAPRLTW